METKIKSITEAFSMQPQGYQTWTQEQYDAQVKKENDNPKLPKRSGGYVKEIIPETRQVDTDKQCNYYVGYDFNGKMMFEYLQSSVNVHYSNE